MKRYFFIVTISIFTALVSLGQNPTKVNFSKAEKITLQNCKLENLYRIDDGIFRSEQPSTDDFIALEKYGIREVLSLRNYNDDLSEVRKTSITPHTFRTRASKIGEDDLIAALKIINNRKGAILIHCWHGSDRTGAVCAMYRIIFQGWSKEAAIHEMVNGGFGFHIDHFGQIIDVIRNSDVERIKIAIKK